MDLEMITLSEVSQIETNKYFISLLCEILQNDTNEFIYKAEIQSQTQKTNPWLPKGKEAEEG